RAHFESHYMTSYEARDAVGFARALRRRLAWSGPGKRTARVSGAPRRFIQPFLLAAALFFAAFSVFFAARSSQERAERRRLEAERRTIGRREEELARALEQAR